MHGVASGLALDTLCVVDVGRAASDATFRVNGVDTVLAADQGTLARVSKLDGNALLLHDIAFSERIFGTENTPRSLCIVSRVVPGCACWLSLRKMLCGGAPLQLLGLNSSSSIKHIILRTVYERLVRRRRALGRIRRLVQQQGGGRWVGGQSGHADAAAETRRKCVVVA